MLYLFVHILVVAAMILLTPQEAKAYVDPGSGSLLLQFCLAAAVGGIYHFRRFVGRLRWWK